MRGSARPTAVVMAAICQAQIQACRVVRRWGSGSTWRRSWAQSRVSPPRASGAWWWRPSWLARSIHQSRRASELPWSRRTTPSRCLSPRRRSSSRARASPRRRSSSRTRSRARHPTKSLSASRSRSILAAELALIQRARTAEPAQALLLLERHALDFPKGALSSEREALRAVAACTLDQLHDARAAVERLSALDPGPLLLQRVQAACGKKIGLPTTDSVRGGDGSF